MHETFNMLHSLAEFMKQSKELNIGFVKNVLSTCNQLFDTLETRFLHFLKNEHVDNQLLTIMRNLQREFCDEYMLSQTYYSKADELWPKKELSWSHFDYIRLYQAFSMSQSLAEDPENRLRRYLSKELFSKDFSVLTPFELSQIFHMQQSFSEEVLR